MSRSSSNARGKARFIGVASASILIIVMVLALVGLGRLRMPVTPDFEGTGNGVTELVEITPGSSVSALGPELVERGIVKSNAAFQKAAGANDKASTVTPGFYRLQGQMSAVSAVEALVDPANKVQLLTVNGGSTLNDVTVVGGGTRFGIFSDIAALACGDKPDSNCVTVAKLADAAATTDPVELGVPAWAVDAVTARGDDPRRIEGLIAPGSYVVNPHMSATEILTDLVTRSAAVWDKTGITAKAEATGLTPYQLLTAASLVERESPAGEFDKVARVIINRLNTPMRLEFDSTVNYDLADQEVATTDDDRARVTPWNTYAKDGLPDTPIASPSVEALEAMENPADGDWLFFVTIDKDGTTVFNNTFDEHLSDTQKALDAGVLDSKRDQSAAGGDSPSDTADPDQAPPAQ
ncbi:endolytic transglycosylase MltG [Corynebacterium mendelii]|uniref:Endolytic murein transglycosylase n=1 Tax=Corynebacterium mendelii TaxID=2765362 RepID=A0A939IWG7_9CORY|nr:endolytic transglycosylase MltG [Corynebacterium mendelii]MBN9643400.1 endolytic transglycosylase MltG [Corynebacterium mendelii]